jgi:cell division protein ZapA
MLERKDMPAEGNRQVIRIMGEEYLIRGSDTSEYMQEIAAFVEAHFEKIAGRDAKLNKTQIAVLAALQIADDYYKFRREYQQTAKFLDEAR